MKVALVHDWLTGVRGGEKCLDPLCRQFPHAQLFTLLHRAGSATPAIERMQIRTSFLQLFPGVDRVYRYCLPLMPRAVERFKLPDDVDVIVSLSHAVAKGVVPPPGVPHVCYCFTPMRYAWHLRDQYFGKLQGAAAGGWWRRIADGTRHHLLDRLRDWDRLSSDRVTHFVAISHTVQRRIRECYGRSSIVIYPPVDTDFYFPTEVPREEFYLCVSALVPYKRIELAVQACNRLKRQLYIIGCGPQQRSLAKLAGPTVQLLGRCPDSLIRHYLRRCRALLFPGCEDFGIVPVEAQACGAPVIAFSEGGAGETVLPADEQAVGTGRFFQQQTVDGVCAAMTWLEDHPDQLSARLARRQAVRFNADRFARQLIGQLHQVVGERGLTAADPARRLAA